MVSQNAPNPFNLDTRISFTLREAEEVFLSIYDVSGRRVRSLVDRRVYPGGTHSVRWDGRDDHGRQVGAGTFFYRLGAGDATVTRRAVMIK